MLEVVTVAGVWTETRAAVVVRTASDFSKAFGFACPPGYFERDARPLVVCCAEPASLVSTGWSASNRDPLSDLREFVERARSPLRIHQRGVRLTEAELRFAIRCGSLRVARH